MFTAYPKFRQLFTDILQEILSHGDAYVPVKVALGPRHSFRSISFDPSKLEALNRIWESEEPHSIWLFSKEDPVQFSISIGRTPTNFYILSITLERDYLKDPRNVSELLQTAKNLYEIIHPAYGSIMDFEEVMPMNASLGNASPTEIRRALPGVYWANFLGPEYVELFGADRVFSTSCYRLERLKDGGVLLVLSPSPLDYHAEPEKFKQLASEVKIHLGEDAFDTGDPFYHGSTPKFRWQDEWPNDQGGLALRRVKQDILSSVSHEQWKKWVLDSPLIARKFVASAVNNGFLLDFSENSLDLLDTYLENARSRPASLDLGMLLNVASYVSEVIIKKTGATWAFEGADELPSLKIDKITVNPLSRTLKVLEEREKFKPWFELVSRELVPQLKSTEGSQNIRG